MDLMPPRELRELTEQERTMVEGHQQWLRDPSIDKRAIFDGMDLSYTDLSHLDLSKANFEGTNLTGACLSHSNFYDAWIMDARLANVTAGYANFAQANLLGASMPGAVLDYSDFTHAQLSGVNFTRASLRGAKLSYTDCDLTNFTAANLNKATLSRGIFKQCIFKDATGLQVAEDAPERLVAVARAALETPRALNMRRWHTCDTTHCICGWGEFLGGPLAKLIIQTHGETLGGLMLLGVEAYEYFFEGYDVARMFLQAVLRKADSAETSLANSQVKAHE